MAVWTFTSETELNQKLKSGNEDVIFHNITCTGDAFGFPAPVLPADTTCESLTVTLPPDGMERVVIAPDSIKYYDNLGTIGTIINKQSVKTATLEPLIAEGEIGCTGILSATQMWTSTETQTSNMKPTGFYTADTTGYINAKPGILQVGNYSLGAYTSIYGDNVTSMTLQATQQVLTPKVLTNQLSTGTPGGTISLYGSPLTSGAVTDSSITSTQLATVQKVWEIVGSETATTSKVQNQPGQAGQYYTSIATAQSLQYITVDLQYTVDHFYVHTCTGPDFQDPATGLYWDNIATTCTAGPVSGYTPTGTGYIICGMGTSTGTPSAGNYTVTVHLTSNSNWNGTLVVKWNFTMWNNP